MTKSYTKSANKSTTTNNLYSKKEDFSEITIERCPHDKENPYVMVRRATIKDQSISPDCRLLISYILCNVDTWIINQKNIEKEFSNWWGRDKVTSLIHEAIEHGYMRKEVKKEKGFIRKTKLFISENPCFSKNVHHTDKPLRRTRIYNKEQANVYKKNNTEKATTPPSSAIIVFRDENREFSIPQEIYESLLTKLGKSRLEETLESIKNWLAEKEKRRFSKKDIEKKIIEWDSRFQRTKKDLAKRKEVEEEAEREKNKRKVEAEIEKNKNFLQKVEREYNLDKIIKKSPNGVLLRGNPDYLCRFSDERFIQFITTLIDKIKQE